MSSEKSRELVYGSGVVIIDGNPPDEEELKLISTAFDSVDARPLLMLTGYLSAKKEKG